MAIRDLIDELKKDKKRFMLLKVLLTLGICLIAASYLFSGRDNKKASEESTSAQSLTVAEYRIETERRLTDFLKDIEGVGEVRVYLTFDAQEEYVYAREGKTSVSENKKEEEFKYVMIGGSSDKTALVETVRLPQVSGAVIACSGSGDPAVCGTVYKAASAALGIPTGCIYVTKLR